MRAIDYRFGHIWYVIASSQIPGIKEIVNIAVLSLVWSSVTS